MVIAVSGIVLAFVHIQNEQTSSTASTRRKRSRLLRSKRFTPSFVRMSSIVVSALLRSIRNLATGRLN